MFAAVTLLGMTMGQPLGPDSYAMNSRTIKLPIEYKKDKKTIRHVLLYVARNGENTWYQEGFVTPDKDSFVYVAKEDGIYWFKMVIEDLKGNKDPADLTRDPADLKMVIDTTPPLVRVTNAKRTGEKIVIEWAIEDKFPNDAETKVHFRPTNDPRAFWTEVKRDPTSPAGVGFPSGTMEAVTVRITAADVAGNRTEVTKDYPAANDQSTSLSPPVITPPPVPKPEFPPLPPVKTDTGMGTVNPGIIVPPPDPVGVGPIGPGPIGPGPAPPQPNNTVQPYQPIQPQPTPNNTNVVGAGGPIGGGDLKPLPTVDPKAPPTKPQPAPPVEGNTWPGAAPTVEVTRAQVINYARFDLGFDLEKRGPSGLSRVDLWVTRDEGKTWRKWSQHDGKGGAVRVTLDAPGNTQIEGNYGFRLVAVSGANLSEREPVAGDAPDMRVVVDVTAPQIELWPAKPDPNNADTLILHWVATDKNFGDDPITLEWSENAAGPWHPVASTGSDPVVQATAMNTPVAKRLANTGQYGWRVPAGTPAHVYLKITARDAAGNVTERVTTKPIAVDLTTPRAKINGIVPPVTPRP